MAQRGCGKRLVTGGAVCVAVGVGVIWGGALHVKLPRGESLPPASGEWIGAVHVHTQASDGGGTVDDVGRAAEAAGLDFVIITDHNTRAAAESNWHDDVLVMIGEEVSTNDGHLVVLGAPANWRPSGTKKTLEVLDAAKKAGAVRIIAHPRGTRRPWDAPTSEFEGVELWNADAEWRNDGVVDWVTAAVSYPVNPELGMLALFDRPSESLAFWDDALAKRPVAGVCSVDAHARVPITKSFSIAFPRYQQTFELLRMHVLLDRTDRGAPADVADRITRALAAGRAYCSVDALADGSDLVFKATNGTESAGLGQWLPWRGQGRISVILPPGGEEGRIKLLRSGEIVAEEDGRALDFDLPGPGTYRVEAEVRMPGLLGGRGHYVPWIYTNPIYVAAESPR